MISASLGIVSVLWHCDMLTLGPASPKFKGLTRGPNPMRGNADYFWELAVLLATPGVRHLDARNWFRRKLDMHTIRTVEGWGLDVAEFGRRNAASVVEADAWAMLALTPPGSSPALWGRALAVQVGAKAVASQLGVPEAIVRRWVGVTAGLTLGGPLRS